MASFFILRKLGSILILLRSNVWLSLTCPPDVIKPEDHQHILEHIHNLGILPPLMLHDTVHLDLQDMTDKQVDEECNQGMRST
jgi:hypothetical protein